MRVKSVLSTVAVGLMLVVGLDYVAYGATGRSLVLGQTNKANQTTGIKRTTAGPALALKVKAGSAPFTVNSGTKVGGLNADRLDGLDSAAFLERVSALVPPSCQSLASVTTTYQKLTDVGSFTTSPATRYTRIDYGTTFKATLGSATSVVFELRVDGLPTTLGRAVYLVKNDDPAYGDLTGIFPDLAPGSHTLSVWTRSTVSGATSSSVDTGCSSVANNVYVTEFR